MNSQWVQPAWQTVLESLWQEFFQCHYIHTCALMPGDHGNRCSTRTRHAFMLRSRSDLSILALDIALDFF